jgi:hypothetical protein
VGERRNKKAVRATTPDHSVVSSHLHASETACSKGWRNLRYTCDRRSVGIYGLAYNLYLIAHNVRDIESRLIQRLKNPQNFHGAFYETRVAAELIKAGLELEYENEDDRSTSHCEFTARYTQTQKQFSVEAKSRPADLQRNGRLLRVGRQLHAALEKEAKFQSLVFIDINRPAGETKEEAAPIFDHAVAILKRDERLLINGKPAPPAYVCLTNYPDEYSLYSPTLKAGVFVGYKIDDFGYGTTFGSIRAAVRAREKHAEIYALEKSIIDHPFPPSTFDGQLPTTAFGDGETSGLLIGRRYLVPQSNGEEVAGVLEDAVVLVNERVAYGIYKLDNDRRIIATSPLTPEELEDYQHHPDTFFGVYKKVPERSDDPVDLFYFFYETYKETPKERLLEFIKDAPDFDDFERLSQKDLAEAVCERWVHSVIQRSDKKQST